MDRREFLKTGLRGGLAAWYFINFPLGSIYASAKKKAELERVFDSLRESLPRYYDKVE